MGYEISLGRLGNRAPRAPSTAKFRIAVLGDFSGRASRGSMDVGDALAGRKPIKLDIDNIDTVIERFGAELDLPLGEGGSTVKLAPRSLEDLHPDALYRDMELFTSLSGIRKRLQNSSTFQAAAKELRVLKPDLASAPRPSRRSRSNAVRVDAKLSDFRRLIGAEAARPDPIAASVDDIVLRAIGPHLRDAANPDQARFVAAVDAALSETMRTVLHQPDFQALEAAWRGLDLLVRRVETSTRMQIVLYDVSADELAADLAATDDLGATGLYRMLVEQPALDAQQGPFSLIFGNYQFELTPPHAELLGRIARIAGQARAPFVASVGTECIDTKLEDMHPMVVEAWGALRAMPEARFLSLTVPRFLLRTPYGPRTDPIGAFKFEEFDPRSGLQGMLWGSAGWLAVVLLAEQFNRSGSKMELGKMLSIGDLPYFFYTDADGDQVALPCTERLLTERKVISLVRQNVIPVLALKGRPEVRLAGFGSVGGGSLLGPWTPADELANLPTTPDTVREASGGGGAEAASSESTTDAIESSDDTASDQAAAADTADDELDKLMAELNAASEAVTAPASESGPASESVESSEDAAATAEAAPAEAVESADDELDKLLAELNASTEPSPPKEAEGDVDDELAKLLKELG